MIYKYQERPFGHSSSDFSINNKFKAGEIEQTLADSLRRNVKDVRQDNAVQQALGIHRIFSFFGFKKTLATIGNELDLKLRPAVL